MVVHHLRKTYEFATYQDTARIVRFVGRPSPNVGWGAIVKGVKRSPVAPMLVRVPVSQSQLFRPFTSDTDLDKATIGDPYVHAQICAHLEVAKNAPDRLPILVVANQVTDDNALELGCPVAWPALCTTP